MLRRPILMTFGLQCALRVNWHLLPCQLLGCNVQLVYAGSRYLVHFWIVTCPQCSDMTLADLSSKNFTAYLFWMDVSGACDSQWLAACCQVLDWHLHQLQCADPHEA